MTRVLERLYPEQRAGGFSRADGTVAYYSRVNALLQPDHVVVDFGAGRGGIGDETPSYRRDLQILRGRVKKVIGIDVDPVVLENPTVDEAVVWVPGTPIGLPDASVDLIVSEYTFEHVEDPAEVARELERILKPGGWICARTPNKWGYIALGARVVPNGLHARALTRLQPGRQERDVFPTRYRMNTLRSVRRWFPEPSFDVLGYTIESEPNYFGNSRIMIYAMYGLMKMLPQRLGSMYLFFIQKSARPD